MAKNRAFEEFKGDLTESDIKKLITLAKKKRTKYLIGWLVSWVIMIAINAIGTLVVRNNPTISMVFAVLSFIPVVCAGIFTGFGCYTNNVLGFLVSRGRRDGGGIVSILWAVVGGLIIPLIVIFVCNKTFPVKILGWTNCGITFTSRNRY